MFNGKNSTPVVNFTNILRDAFTRASQKKVQRGVRRVILNTGTSKLVISNLKLNYFEKN